MMAFFFRVTQQLMAVLPSRAASFSRAIYGLTKLHVATVANQLSRQHALSAVWPLQGSPKQQDPRPLLPLTG